MSDTAEAVAGKLLGHVQCQDCEKWFLNNKTWDFGGNIEWRVCDKCVKHYESRPKGRGECVIS